MFYPFMSEYGSVGGVSTADSLAWGSLRVWTPAEVLIGFGAYTMKELICTALEGSLGSGSLRSSYLIGSLVLLVWSTIK